MSKRGKLRIIFSFENLKVSDLYVFLKVISKNKLQPFLFKFTSSIHLGHHSSISKLIYTNLEVLYASTLWGVATVGCCGGRTRGISKNGVTWHYREIPGLGTVNRLAISDLGNRNQSTLLELGKTLTMLSRWIGSLRRYG